MEAAVDLSDEALLVISGHVLRSIYSSRRKHFALLHALSSWRWRVRRHRLLRTGLRRLRRRHAGESFGQWRRNATASARAREHAEAMGKLGDWEHQVTTSAVATQGELQAVRSQHELLAAAHAKLEAQLATARVHAINEASAASVASAAQEAALARELRVAQSAATERRRSRAELESQREAHRALARGDTFQRPPESVGVDVGLLEGLANSGSAVVEAAELQPRHRLAATRIQHHWRKQRHWRDMQSLVRALRVREAAVTFDAEHAQLESACRADEAQENLADVVSELQRVRTSSASAHAALAAEHSCLQQAHATLSASESSLSEKLAAVQDKLTATKLTLEEARTQAVHADKMEHRLHVAKAEAEKLAAETRAKADAEQAAAAAERLAEVVAAKATVETETACHVAAIQEMEVAVASARAETAALAAAKAAADADAEAAATAAALALARADAGLDQQKEEAAVTRRELESAESAAVAAREGAEAELAAMWESHDDVRAQHAATEVTLEAARTQAMHATKVEQLLHEAKAEAEQNLFAAKVEAERMVASAQQDAEDAREREQMLAEDDSSTDDDEEGAIAMGRDDTRAAEAEAELRLRFEELLAVQLAETVEAQRQLADARSELVAQVAAAAAVPKREFHSVASSSISQIEPEHETEPEPEPQLEPQLQLEPLSFKLPGELSAMNTSERKTIISGVRARLPPGGASRIELSAGSVIVTVHWSPGAAEAREVVAQQVKDGAMEVTMPDGTVATAMKREVQVQSQLGSELEPESYLTPVLLRVSDEPVVYPPPSEVVNVYTPTVPELKLTLEPEPEPEVRHTLLQLDNEPEPEPELVEAMPSPGAMLSPATVAERHEHGRYSSSSGSSSEDDADERAVNLPAFASGLEEQLARDMEALQLELAESRDQARALSIKMQQEADTSQLALAKSREAVHTLSIKDTDRVDTVKRQQTIIAVLEAQLESAGSLYGSTSDAEREALVEGKRLAEKSIDNLERQMAQDAEALQSELAQSRHQVRTMSSKMQQEAEALQLLKMQMAAKSTQSAVVRSTHGTQTLHAALAEEREREEKEAKEEEEQNRHQQQLERLREQREQRKDHDAAVAAARAEAAAATEQAEGFRDQITELESKHARIVAAHSAATAEAHRLTHRLLMHVELDAYSAGGGSGANSPAGSNKENDWEAGGDSSPSAREKQRRELVAVRAAGGFVPVAAGTRKTPPRQQHTQQETQHPKPRRVSGRTRSGEGGESSGGRSRQPAAAATRVTKVTRSSERAGRRGSSPRTPPVSPL